MEGITNMLRCPLAVLLTFKTHQVSTLLINSPGTKLARGFAPSKTLQTFWCCTLYDIVVCDCCATDQGSLNVYKNIKMYIKCVPEEREEPEAVVAAVQTGPGDPGVKVIKLF
jgi:hypothetical protein